MPPASPQPYDGFDLARTTDLLFQWLVLKVEISVDRPDDTLPYTVLGECTCDPENQCQRCIVAQAYFHCLEAMSDRASPNVSRLAQVHEARALVRKIRTLIEKSPGAPLPEQCAPPLHLFDLVKRRFPFSPTKEASWRDQADWSLARELLAQLDAEIHRNEEMIKRSLFMAAPEPHRGRPRLELLNHLEHLLDIGGFSDREIAALIDDGNGDGNRVHRVADRRAKTDRAKDPRWILEGFRWNKTR